jgi:tetratricopeptide (TPR) repeat protein
MKTINLITAILVVVASRVQAAASLRGVVLANELGGSPMGNVEVSALAGNPNTTGADGKFSFTFPNRNPGDTVRLIVHKEGYVVVNDIQLELTLPADPDARPAIFLLCKEGDREEMARRFYRLKGDEVINETYRKKFEEAQNATAAELAKLRQERDQAKEAAEKVTEELAKQKPGVGSELYRTAMRLFLDGKVDPALVTLSDEKLRELSKAAEERKPEAEKTTGEAIQAWLLKAQLLTVQFRFHDAEKAYQGAIETSPESFEANFAFAWFNQQLNHYDKAMTAYGRCLELARRNQDKAKIAATLNNLAILDGDQNRPKAARKGYEEALKIYRQLVQENPDTYSPNVALTLNNLANLDRDQNRPEAARKGYEEALKIYRQLVQKHPNIYLSYLAVTLNNLANLDRDQNRPEVARNGYEGALNIRRELAKNNPDTYLPKVALTLNNLARLDRNQNRPEAARGGYEEALKIYRQLVKNNPDTYLPDLAMTLNSLANLDRDQDRVEAARSEYQEALKIRRELAKNNPDTYLPNVASTLNSLANLDADQNRVEAARKGFEEALDIYRRFAERNPERFQSDVARVKRQLQTLNK